MILQRSLPHTPWSDPRLSRLPGTQPLDFKDWLVVDDAYSAQMAERDRLIAEQPAAVCALDASAREAGEELLELVLGDLDGRPEFRIAADGVTRPDDVLVPLDRTAPMQTLGRLVQEDFCILQPGGEGEHILSGAILCFPSEWTLAEKFMRPLSRIHRPVAPYDANIAARVQRMFDAVPPGRVLWRANAHPYDDPSLFMPRPEVPPRRRAQWSAPFVRSERQCILRLPEAGAIVFSIHTYVLRREDLSPEQRATLPGAGEAQG